MPLSVIQQPNGRFAVWRTDRKCFALVDADKGDVRRLVVAEGSGVFTARALLKRATRTTGWAPPPFTLAECVDRCEAINPDDMLLPMVKAILRDAP
jgi:hypothetical protein